MNLLKIQLMNSCDKNCYYCPAQKWHKPIDFRFPDTTGDGGLRMNTITNETLLKWLDMYINCNEWIIEITGGEPSLYPEIETLIQELNNKNYHGIIRTNGSGNIPKTNNFIIVTAWHLFWENELPKNYDLILILKNPKDNWRKKVEYCNRYNIPYKLSNFDESFKNKKSIIDNECTVVNKLKGISYISSMGQIAGCQRKQLSENLTIFNMSVPVIEKMGINCGSCIHLTHIESVLSNKIMELL